VNVADVVSGTLAVVAGVLFFVGFAIPGKDVQADSFDEGVGCGLIGAAVLSGFISVLVWASAHVVIR
jgi:hypothetical protein